MITVSLPDATTFAFTTRADGTGYDRNWATTT